MKYFLGAAVYVAISIAIVGLTIYPDSYLYFNSASVMFTDNFAGGYQFVREPGYPLMIKFILFFVESFNFRFDFMLIGMQSAMLFFSGVALLKAFNVRLTKSNLLIFIISVLNPVYISLSGQLLQTTSLIFCTSICAYCISLTMEKSELIKKEYLFIGISTTFSYLIGLQVGILFIMPILLITIKKIVSSTEGKNFRYEILLITSILSIVSLWQIFKTSELEVSDKRNSVLVANSYDLISLNTFKIDSTDLLTFQNVMSLNLKQLSEIEILARNALGGNECGVWYPTGEAYTASVMAEKISSKCRDGLLRNINNELIDFGMIFYRFITTFYLIGIIFCLFTRKWRFFLISTPAMFLHLEYTLINFNVDRYGAPLYLFGVLNFAIIFSSVTRNLKSFFINSYYKSRDKSI